MKTRQSFVSNSSSSSFIVSSEEAEALKGWCKVYSKDEIRAKIKALEDLLEKFAIEAEGLKEPACYLSALAWAIEDTQTAAYQIPDGYFVTDPVNRDEALNHPVLSSCSVFEEY